MLQEQRVRVQHICMHFLMHQNQGWRSVQVGLQTFWDNYQHRRSCLGIGTYTCKDSQDAKSFRSIFWLFSCHYARKSSSKFLFDRSTINPTAQDFLHIDPLKRRTDSSVNIRWDARQWKLESFFETYINNVRMSTYQCEWLNRTTFFYILSLIGTYSIGTTTGFAVDIS